MDSELASTEDDAHTTTLEGVEAPMLISDRSTASATLFHHHGKLVEWVVKNDGYLHPSVQIAHSFHKGFHAVVAPGRRVLARTRIASCPMPATLSVLNALDATPFSCRGTYFPRGFLRQNLGQPEMIQAFFLMEQFIIGDKSWWAPYIRTLPTLRDVEEWQWEKGEDVEWIEGTNLKIGVAAQVAKWQDMYAVGIRQLKQLKWPNALNGTCTWELFRWAATIFGSRSFTSEVLADTLPADKARPAGCDSEDHEDLCKLFSDRFAVLLPLMDLLNHQPGAQVEWQARYSFVGLQVLQTHDSGQELCNNYGPRDNGALLLAYGFAIPDNPFDHVMIALKAPPGSPLAHARSWKRDLRSDQDGRCYLFGVNHPRSQSASFLETSVFSFDLLDSISVLCANDRELQAMYQRQQTLMSYALTPKHRFDDSRNVLSTLSQLMRDCSARAARLQSTDPTRSGLVPTSTKQQFAKIYRDGQRDIVETAIAVCRYVLRRALSKGRGHHVLPHVIEDTPEQVAKSLEILVSRHPMLTRAEELFTGSDLLQMLPPALASTLRLCLSELEVNLVAGHRHRDGFASSHQDMEKSRLAFLLSAMYAEYSRGVKLPARLNSWVTELSHWYPPDDENWSSVPHPGPWAPGEEPDSTLMALLAASRSLSPSVSNGRSWWKAERICWAWSVVEEEGVQIPAELFQDSVARQDERHRDHAFLVYCRQY